MLSVCFARIRGALPSRRCPLPEWTALTHDNPPPLSEWLASELRTLSQFHVPLPSALCITCAHPQLLVLASGYLRHRNNIFRCYQCAEADGDSRTLGEVM